MRPDQNPAGAAAFQQMLAQLRRAFLDELPERFNHLESLALSLEKQGGLGEAFNELFRNVHSLKGSGGTHGLHIFTTICHQLEDLLNAIAGNELINHETIGILLAYIDLLRQAHEEIGQGHTAFPFIEKKLAELRQALSAKQYSVLLVDNSRLSTNIYQQILEAFPVNTVVVEDGYLALMRALTQPFDLMITANEIPLLNGVALIGALRLSRTKNQDIKTILITSSANLVRQRKRSIDADYIIPKDTQIARNLEAAVRSTLDGFGKRDQKT